MTSGAGAGVTSRVGAGVASGAGTGIAQEPIDSAANLLLQARLALVYGLVNSTVEAQREAARIADLLRGVIDSAASPGHQGAQAAFELEGSLTASLGEMKRRANLVVFWGCDPDRIFPGFLDRYAPARAGRLRISVDVGEGLGPDGVDERVALPPGREIEALLALRALVRGRRVEAERAVALGLEVDPLRRLARQIANCGYGAIVSDADPPSDRRDPERAGALGALVRDARGKARLRLVGVRRPGNPVGAESVLTWQTGFPGAISFASGAPRYGPGEFTGEAVLARGEVDAALVVGADPAAFLSAPALQTLNRLPTVFIGGADAPGHGSASIRIATAPFGATAGHVFRMDGVALRQRPAQGGLRSEIPGGAALPTEADVLRRLADAIVRCLDDAPDRRTPSDEDSVRPRGQRQ